MARSPCTTGARGLRANPIVTKGARMGALTRSQRSKDSRQGPVMVAELCVGDAGARRGACCELRDAFFRATPATNQISAAPLKSDVSLARPFANRCAWRFDPNAAAARRNSVCFWVTPR
jgi:hypothetical protein